MIRLIDGEAAGETLMLRRAPKLLRVVKSPRGNWDALDQLSDQPKPNEKIFVYQRRDDLEVGTYHLCIRGKGKKEGGWYARASYSVLPSQPADELVRTTDAWRQWASEKVGAEYEP